MELIRCPFCGGDDPRMIHTEDYYAYRKCNKCGACGPEVAIFELCEGSSSKEVATDLWNKRFKIAEQD